MRYWWVVLLLVVLATSAQASASLVACWAEEGATLVGALADGELRVARVSPTGLEEIAAIPSPALTTVAAGAWQGNPALLAANGAALLRLDLASRAWRPVGAFPAPIRQILPSPEEPGAVVLTGAGSGPAPTDGKVWWASWRGAFRASAVAAVKDRYRPWQLWWAAAYGEQRLAIATFTATPYVPFEHNCMFLFAWQGGAAEARWLGSRLSRPYVEATHADLRGDGDWRMVAVEVTREGGRGLTVYRPIGFGYEGEWEAESVPGLERVAAYGEIVLCWGHGADGKPCAWRLLPEAEAAYRLVSLAEAPPDLERVARIDGARLAGWWDGAWRVLRLPTPQR